MYEQPIDRVLRFLKDLYPNGPFNAMYDGDPDLIPVSSLPAICVVKNMDTTSVGPTGMDKITEVIVIKVVLNKRDDWGGDSNVQLTEKRIRDLVEARDLTTGQYLPQSIKGAFRTKLTMENVLIDQTMSFELGILPRPQDLITSEGHLTLTLTYQVPIGSRT